MTREEYAEQFYKNLKIMSRTANGILDTSSSPTKADSLLINDGTKAKDIIYENIDKAIYFLYDNKTLTFNSPKELESFVLKLVKITNRGIVKENFIFRNGEDSTKYKYAKIKDIPKYWNWFIERLYADFTYTYLSIYPYEIAAFCEYIINMVAHFFQMVVAKSLCLCPCMFLCDMTCPL